ncbi:MAG: hypothetical protein HF978_10595 [Desulfobacteraceae bacterium]|nr:hypothetical protein [Desulfobacteraceae bacterium]MBC2755983.1 hypothetical protein [Desulfobacteraceae bacterium]
MHQDRLHDGAVEFRLKKNTGFNDWLSLDFHYEVIGTGGETRKAQQQFLKQYPVFSDSLFMANAVKDDSRVMDLTHTISSDTEYLLYHRIDRLVLSASADWGSVRVGRQALTWGNGFLFNPMDLFNPFSPTDVDRDYKIGDDMITAQVYTGNSGELQMLYMPRRDTENHNIEWDDSSLAAKFHFNISITDIDVMAGKHYEDNVLGIGFTGYLMNAAWRLDTTYTWLDADSERSGFVSLVANIDYSWVWWNKNLYGWIEYYYNGLGENDYQKALTDPDIMKRLARGEWFTLGHSYMNTQLQIEWHPLVNGFITIITNTGDSSGILQPRITVDPAQNFQIMCGGNIYYGKTKTEFGGIELPGVLVREVPADMVYLWLSYYF